MGGGARRDGGLRTGHEIGTLDPVEVPGLSVDTREGSLAKCVVMSLDHH